MAEVRVKMNLPGINEFMKSAPIEAHLLGIAERIAAAAGEGFEPDSGQTRYVARASVRTVTYDAAKAEATDKVLTSAIGAGRG